MKISIPALTLATCLVACQLASCKKDKNQTGAAAPEAEPAAGEDPGAADPHAGLGSDPHAGLGSDPQGAEPANPHGGAEPANPHGGGDPHSTMQGGGPGGKTLEKAADGRAVMGPVTLAVPKGWAERPTKSGMRAAEWSIPGKSGEAELVVYFFGAGGAGSSQANLDRWYQQFEQPDGKPSAEAAKTEKKTVAGMAVTLVELSGRYVAAKMPGSTEKHDSPDHMMLAAIAETSGGPYYFKLVGPKATVLAVKKDFRGLITSMKPTTGTSP